MNSTLTIFESMKKMPLGRRLFSRIVCLKAPYFGTIRPLFRELRPGFGELTMKKRRAVTNHLKSVHAIAMANMCELIGGMVTEVSIPASMRWIPRTMMIEYLKIARTDLKAWCEIPLPVQEQKQDLPVVVHVVDTAGIEVVRATISMYLSGKDAPRG